MNERTFNKRELDEHVKSFGLTKALHEIKPHQINDDFLRKLWEDMVNAYVQVVTYVRR